MAQAAEVTFVGKVEHQGSEAVGFRFEGEINDTDSTSIKAALAKAGIANDGEVWPSIIVELDSSGGSYQSGLDLALLFRRLGLATVVKSGDRCFSACALAFLGGTQRATDPTPAAEDGPIPNQLPDRSIERDALLGFHAPYLSLNGSSYTADNVSEAYTAAVLGISRFIAIADHLYVSTAELPKLLKPTRDDLFMADNVDAVRFLGIDYTDYTLQIRDLQSITPSMILNACVNRYYHLRGRSSLPGYDAAASVREEFIEGSKLLENGEEKQVFAVRRIKYGERAINVVFTPIAKTDDGRSFIWCLFGPVGPDATTIYKPAGTIEELFAELKTGGGQWWEFSSSETTIKVGHIDTIETMMRVLDMVPPETKLADVGATVKQYQANEPPISQP
ncbi:hypothetical protein NKI34_31725 [Mesorhizobium sp. M0700]|uniref:hypothetical protein n=1 Tax=Mesorhizobium sp. M0700 TaxID=2956988 RepID=UPI00333D3ED7